MDYWKCSFDRNGYVYSCDMLRYKLGLRKDCLKALNRYFASPSRMDIKSYPLNTAQFKYRYLYTVTYGKSSMTAGLGFNGASSDDMMTGFFEVNPNKCFGSVQCLRDIQMLHDCTWKTEPVRFDLAVDIPLPRAGLSLAKDGRKYMLDMYSTDNKTEYLGVRNQGGFVKLYNKGLEQEDDRSVLTRLEMTCEGGWDSGEIMARLPYVNTVFHAAGGDGLSGLNSAQRVLVRALRSSPERDELFKCLNATTRVKLRPFIYGDAGTVVYDESCITDVLGFIRSFEHDLDALAYWMLKQEDLSVPFEA